MFNKPFTKSKRFDGIIGFHRLDDFWISCTPSEQDALTSYCRRALNAQPDSSPIKGKVASPNGALTWFTTNISWAASEHNYLFADKLIAYGSKQRGIHREIHFFYNAVYECYYRQRDLNAGAIGKAKEYCKKDMELFHAHKDEFRDPITGAMPSMPSFKQYAIICEKQGEFQEAIDICRLALSYGLDDGTKGGYEGRIKKLENKLAKA